MYGVNWKEPMARWMQGIAGSGALPALVILWAALVAANFVAATGSAALPAQSGNNYASDAPIEDRSGKSVRVGPPGKGSDVNGCGARSGAVACATAAFALGQLPPDGVLLFEPGRYLLDETLNVTRSVTLAAAGAWDTTLWSCRPAAPTGSVRGTAAPSKSARGAAGPSDSVRGAAVRASSAGGAGRYAPPPVPTLLVTLDAQGARRAVFASGGPDVSVAMCGIAVVGGRAAGLPAVGNATLGAAPLPLRRFDGSGGGLLAAGVGAVSLVGCVFRDNGLGAPAVSAIAPSHSVVDGEAAAGWYPSAGGGGAAVFAQSVVVRNSYFVGNNASQCTARACAFTAGGGGLLVRGMSDPSPGQSALNLTVRGSVFDGNSAGYAGGGLAVHGQSGAGAGAVILDVEDCLFGDNTVASATVGGTVQKLNVNSAALGAGAVVNVSSSGAAASASGAHVAFASITSVGNTAIAGAGRIGYVHSRSGEFMEVAGTALLVHFDDIAAADGAVVRVTDMAVDSASNDTVAIRAPRGAGAGGLNVTVQGDFSACAALPREQVADDDTDDSVSYGATGVDFSFGGAVLVASGPTDAQHGLPLLVGIVDEPEAVGDGPLFVDVDGNFSCRLVSNYAPTMQYVTVQSGVAAAGGGVVVAAFNASVANVRVGGTYTDTQARATGWCGAGWMGTICGPLTAVGGGVAVVLTETVSAVVDVDVTCTGSSAVTGGCLYAEVAGRSLGTPVDGSAAPLLPVDGTLRVNGTFRDCTSSRGGAVAVVSSTAVAVSGEYIRCTSAALFRNEDAGNVPWEECLPSQGGAVYALGLDSPEIAIGGTYQACNATSPCEARIAWLAGQDMSNNYLLGLGWAMGGAAFLGGSAADVNISSVAAEGCASAGVGGALAVAGWFNSTSVDGLECGANQAGRHAGCLYVERMPVQPSRQHAPHLRTCVGEPYYTDSSVYDDDIFDPSRRLDAAVARMSPSVRLSTPETHVRRLSVRRSSLRANTAGSFGGGMLIAARPGYTADRNWRGSRPPFIISVENVSFVDNAANVGGGVALESEFPASNNDLQCFTAERQNPGLCECLEGQSSYKCSVCSPGVSTCVRTGKQIEGGCGHQHLTVGACKGYREWDDQSTQLHMEHSRLSGNVASVSGGGLAMFNGDVQLINVTLLRNAAGDTGGAMYATDSTVVSAEYSTLVRNTAGTRGGAALFSSSTASVQLQHCHLEQLSPKWVDGAAVEESVVHVDGSMWDGVNTTLQCPNGTRFDHEFRTGSETFSGWSIPMTFDVISSACVPCTAGSVSMPGIGMRVELSRHSAAGKCRTCPSGSFNPTPGGAVCQLAQRGHVVPENGSVSQVACAPGFYTESEGLATCAPCPAGSAAKNQGSTRCLPCANGTFSSASGASLCTPCFDGSYAAGVASTSCRPCPYGGRCRNGHLQPGPGFWMGGGGGSHAPTAFVACPQGYCCMDQACLVASGNMSGCAAGRTGLLCSSCRDGLSATIDGAGCAPNDSCDAAAWVLPSMLVLSVGYASVLLRPSRAVSLRLVVQFYQMALLLLGARRAAVRSFVLSLFDLQFEPPSGGSSGTDLLHPCLAPHMGAVGTTLFKLVLPLAVLLVGLPLMSVALRCLRKIDRITDDSTLASTTSVKRAEQRRTPSQQLYVGLLRGVLLATSTLSKVMLALVHCVDVGGAQRLYLAADSVVCYNWWQLLVFVLLACVAAPLPLAMWRLRVAAARRRASTARDEPALSLPAASTRPRRCCASPFRLSDDAARAALDVLDAPYVDGRGGWDAVLLGRLLLVVLLSTVLASAPQVRAMSISVVLCAFLAVSAWARPYKLAFDQLTDSVTGVCLVLLTVLRASAAALQVAGLPETNDLLNSGGLETSLLVLPAALGAVASFTKAKRAARWWWACARRCCCCCCAKRSGRRRHAEDALRKRGGSELALRRGSEDRLPAVGAVDDGPTSGRADLRQTLLAQE